MRVDRQNKKDGMLKWRVAMSTTRRDFIKSFGISIASLVLTRCASNQNPYAVEIEKSSANLPEASSSVEVAIPPKPSATSTQEPTAKTIETQTLEKPTSQIKGHPMTPEDGLKYYPFDDPTLPANTRLRKCWENLYLLERHLYDPNWTGGDPRPMLVNSHLTALDEMVLMGELSQEGARELHEAFLAAIKHVLANSITVICYD
jgi:hypothetical protein